MQSSRMPSQVVLVAAILAGISTAGAECQPKFLDELVPDYVYHVPGALRGLKILFVDAKDGPSAPITVEGSNLPEDAIILLAPAPQPKTASVSMVMRAFREGTSKESSTKPQCRFSQFWPETVKRVGRICIGPDIDEWYVTVAPGYSAPSAAFEARVFDASGRVLTQGCHNITVIYDVVIKCGNLCCCPPCDFCSYTLDGVEYEVPRPDREPDSECWTPCGANKTCGGGEATLCGGG